MNPGIWQALEAAIDRFNEAFLAHAHSLRDQQSMGAVIEHAKDVVDRAQLLASVAGCALTDRMIDQMVAARASAPRQRRMSAEPQDVFLPICYEPGATAESRTRSRYYVFGSVLRGETILPALRTSDGLVLVLAEDDEMSQPVVATEP